MVTSVMAYSSKTMTPPERISGQTGRQEEQEWIRQILDGQTHLFRNLLVRYERMVRTVIRRLVDDEHQVEEIAQQSFITAYENLAKFSGNSRFSTWLCQIALNKARDFLRGRQRREGDIPIGDIEFRSEQIGPEEEIATTERDALLQSALNHLKPSDRELIVFKYLLEYDYETVAEILGCSPPAAKVRSVRARNQLRHILQRMGVDI